MKQNEKGLMQWEKDFLISVTILIIATIIAHIFFYQTAHNINVPMIYTLATFFISRYTKGYGWGIVSSLLSVIFINWRFTFPYFKINFMIDGYPMTFLGILVIAIITNMTTTSLNREKEAAVKREKELAKVLAYQQDDFKGLFEALEGNPVTIRFLDPPLHEFVPTDEADIKKLADAQGKTVEQIKTIIASLHEFNPMMGHRGCRLAVTYPEIAKMQTTAVIRAAIEVKKAHPDWTIKPEIMIPLVGDVKELKYVKKFVVETADAEIKAAGSDLQYEVGTMIEIPRAALTADEIAKEADFFCFGTNDLTQMTYGFSRDDAGKFLNAYYDAKIFENDPFAKLDQDGVGKLMKMAIDLGRPVNSSLHVGICGEHGGDPSSVEFCNKLGLDYVSCSPFRVPIARLAAAQAAIAQKNA